MDGLQDAKNQAGEGAAQQPQGGYQAHHAQTAQVTGAGSENAGDGAGAAGASGNGVNAAGAGGSASKACADFEAALKERDVKIAELEGEIAEAAKSDKVRRTASSESGVVRFSADFYTGSACCRWASSSRSC